jgi:hypothetical protein
MLSVSFEHIVWALQLLFMAASLAHYFYPIVVPHPHKNPLEEWITEVEDVTTSDASTDAADVAKVECTQSQFQSETTRKSEDVTTEADYDQQPEEAMDIDPACLTKPAAEPLVQYPLYSQVNPTCCKDTPASYEDCMGPYSYTQPGTYGVHDSTEYQTEQNFDQNNENARLEYTNMFSNTALQNFSNPDIDPFSDDVALEQYMATGDVDFLVQDHMLAAAFGQFEEAPFDTTFVA